MEKNSISELIPTNQQLLDCILSQENDHFKDVSLIIDNELLKNATSLIDLKQVRKVVTIPGNCVYYEFSKTPRQDALLFCLPYHCKCPKFSSNITNNRSISLCEHLLAIAIIKQNNVDIPTRKVSLSDVLASMK